MRATALSDVKAEIRGHLRVMLVSNLVAPALDEAIAAFHGKRSNYL